MNKEQRELLKLNLQHFSSGEDGAGETGEGEVLDTTKGENAGSENSDNTNTPEVDKTIPYDRFKAKVDEANLLKEQLATLKSAEEKANTEALVEQEKYKELFEQAQEQLQTAKTEAIETKKFGSIVEAGYPKDQADMLQKLVTGETDDEITASLELLKATFPIDNKQDNNGVDPSPMNNKNKGAEPVDGEDIGKKAYEKAKHLFRF